MQRPVRRPCYRRALLRPMQPRLLSQVPAYSCRASARTSTFASADRSDRYPPPDEEEPGVNFTGRETASEADRTRRDPKALARPGLTSAGDRRECRATVAGRHRHAPKPRTRNCSARSPMSISRLRACWVTQASVGWAVIPARCTRRRPCSIHEQDVEAAQDDGIDVGEVDGEDRVGLRGEELSPGRSGPPWCRVDAGALERGPASPAGPARGTARRGRATPPTRAPQGRCTPRDRWIPGSTWRSRCWPEHRLDDASAVLARFAEEPESTSIVASFQVRYVHAHTISVSPTVSNSETTG
jgi:hypothetical protein